MGEPALSPFCIRGGRVFTPFRKLHPWMIVPFCRSAIQTQCTVQNHSRRLSTAASRSVHQHNASPPMAGRCCCASFIMHSDSRSTLRTGCLIRTGKNSAPTRWPNSCARLFLIAQGWHDQNDANQLREDPALCAAVADVRGMAVADKQLASQSTHSRLINTLARPDNRCALRDALGILSPRSPHAAVYWKGAAYSACQ